MKNLILLILLLFPIALLAQTGIGTTTPDASAKLDVSSTNKGFLPPRMTTTERNAIASPASGLVIFNTTTNSLEIKGSSAWTSVVQAGTSSGDMNYWNGNAWVRVAAGNNGQTLTFYNGVPVWNTQVNTVSSNNKIWMDRNLGATRVAVSSTDAAAYGDLYQWGRGTDGHQSRTSATTSSLSSTDAPGNVGFILTSTATNDWRSPKNDNLWQGVNGVNNPCPAGYRLPTETEWGAERSSWSSNNAAGAFASPLKLPMSGYRDYGSGSLNDAGANSFYWSSTVSSTDALYLSFADGGAFTANHRRAYGFSVRCIKN